MADLLSNRADAYARFYFRVRARQGVVQRPVSVHLFFFFFLSARHRRAAGTFFFFVGNQELIRSEAPALFEIAGDTRQVHIFLRRRNRRGT